MKIRKIGGLCGVRVKNFALDVHSPKVVYNYLRDRVFFQFTNDVDLFEIDTPFFTFLYFPYDFWGEMQW